MKANMNSLYFYSYELLESLLFELFEQGLFGMRKIVEKIAGLVNGLPHKSILYEM